VAALQIEALSAWPSAISSLTTLIFDVPAAVVRASADGRTLDKFERQQTAFRPRAVYIARAAAEPQRCRVIDSTRPMASVRAELETIVSAL
jgi:dTMP kinase